MVKRIEYTLNKQITATKQESVTNSIWTAFDKNIDGNVILERQSAFCPNQTFFSLIRVVDKLVSMDANLTNLIVAYQDSILLGEIISLTNPLTTTTNINRELSLVENPIGVTVNTNGIFFLTPGITSSLETEIHVYTTSGVFDETITLVGINNAISITSDNNDEVWVVTNNSPSELIRIFPDGASSYNIEITILN